MAAQVRPTFDALLGEQSPDDLVALMLVSCPAATLARAAAVCRAWRRLVLDACARIVPEQARPRWRLLVAAGKAEPCLPTHVALYEQRQSAPPPTLGATEDAVYLIAANSTPPGAGLLGFERGTVVGFETLPQLHMTDEIRLALTIDRPIGSGAGVRNLSCGPGHSILVTFEGHVYAWGRNGTGELGLRLPGGGVDCERRQRPTRIEGLAEPAAQAAAGDAFGLLRMASGEVLSFGDPSNGALGRPTDASPQPPAPVPGVSAADVATGHGHSVVATPSGDLVTWGAGYAGQLGTGERGNRATPSTVTPPGELIVAVAAGELHSIAIGLSGRLYQFGERFETDQDARRVPDALLPTHVRGAWPRPVVRIVGLPWYSAAITADGDAYLISGARAQKIPRRGVAQVCAYECFTIAICDPPGGHGPPGLCVLDEDLLELEQGEALLSLARTRLV